MCGNVGPKNAKMSFKLIEINPHKAKIMGIEPGFMYLPMPVENGARGYTQAQIARIVFEENAKHGYLGVNYHLWPEYRQLAAKARIRAYAKKKGCAEKVQETKTFFDHRINTAMMMA